MILNEATKMQRFLNGLNKDIVLYILRVAHPTYQLAKYATLEVKK